MAAITKEQIRRVYALGAAAGLLESGNKDDALHAVVRRISGKDNVSRMSGADFAAVEKELMRLTKLGNCRAPLKPPQPKAAAPDDTSPGMMSKAQQGKAWALMYELIKLSPPSSATPGERMVGAIQRILKVDARLKKPFEWISFSQGYVLINSLKQYVASAQRRAEKRGSG